MGPEARRAAALGLGIGLGATFVALGVDLWLRGLGFSVDGVVTAHRTNPLVWLAELTPLGLGLLGLWAGARIDVASADLERLRDVEEKSRPLRRYKTAIGALVDGVLIERRGRIEEANEAAAKILATTPDALAGESLGRFVPGLESGGSGRQVLRCTAQGEVVGISWRYSASDALGRTFELDVASSRLGDERAMHVLRDVTDERREIDRLREMQRSLVDQRDRAMTQAEGRRQSLASIGHEVRTPLTSILGYLELLEEQLSDHPELADSAEDLGRIRASATQILALIEKVHDQAMIEAGRLSLYLGPVDAQDLVTEASGTIRPLLQASRSTLEVDVPVGLPAVRADRQRLRQVLLTLLGNACQFTAEGKIRLAASVTGEGRAASVELVVSDTGRGMTKEQVETLFEAYQGRRPGRAGLGTAIAHELAKLMGGSLRVESEVGRGTTFTLSLPVAQDELKIEQVVRSRSALGGQARAVVLVDDPKLRDRLAAELGARGVEVASATSSAGAIEAAEALKPTALAVDLGLTRGNGWLELALLCASPHFARLPVVAIFQRGERARLIRLAGLQPLPPDRKRLQDRAQVVGDPQGPALVVGVRSAVRALEETGWTVSEVAPAEAAAQLDEAGLLVVDLLSQDAEGLRLVVEGTALPPVIGLLPSPPTDADRTAADALLHAHVEREGVPRDDAITALVTALAEASQ